MKVISWFSGGITSTIATYLALKKYGKENVDIIFFETGAHHPDNERFFSEVEEKLFEKKIIVRRNKKYVDLWDVLSRGYINSPNGAYCTHQLKKKVREQIEKITDYDAQVFGFEFEKKQINRALRFLQQYPKSNAVFPLIEQKVTKEDCINMFELYEIELPMMYRLGYTNNNCVGCVKGGQGYWNKIRIDFPEVFKRMAKLEREVGATCLKKTVGKRSYKLYLDELDPEAGRMEKPIVDECGVVCATEFNHIDSPELQDILEGKIDINDVGLLEDF